MRKFSYSAVAVRCKALTAQLAAGWAGKRFGLIATLLFAAAFLSPQFVDGYGGDDLLNASTPGYLMLAGTTLPQYLADVIHGTICGGRFFPVHQLLLYGVHCVATSEVAFHRLVFVILLADLALFYRLLRLWRLDPSLASLGTLFLALLFQLRHFYDPIVQYSAISPVLVAEILVAMISFERYLVSRRLGWLTASLVAYAGALTTYEIAFMIAPAFVAMARARREGWRQGFAACQPHVALLFAITAFTLGLRHHFAPHATGAYIPRFDLAAICKTTALQASAAIPASYALLSSHRLDNIREGRWAGAWQNWAVFAVAGGLSWVYLRQFTRQAAQLGAQPTNLLQKPSLAMFAIVGGVIWILPGVLIALSPKYQVAVELGLGYLPVFLQYFGVAILAIGFVVWSHAKAPRFWPKLRWAIVMFNALVAMVTFDTNTTVAARMNADPLVKQRSLIESACHAGLFDSTPTGATVWSVQPHAWMIGGPDQAGGHLSKTLGRAMYAVIGDPAPDWLVRRFTPDSIPAPSFVMNDLRPNLDWSYVVLGEVDPAATAGIESQWSTGADRADAYPARNFRLFLSGSYVDRSRQPDQLAIASLRRDETGKPTWCIAQWIDLSQLTVGKRGASGLILEGAFPQPVDMRLVCVFEADDLAARLESDPNLSAMAR